jgi:2-succinyl-6-hydroxy-2,4-cyclohexadiene-1-carboxylate synthase
MFYFDTETDKPVILCLHGRWGRAEVWVDFIRYYGRQYRIIAPDQRGHGLSSKPDSDYTGEEMAGDINQLLDFLKLESVILVGHSMGGQVAGYFAALYPERVKALAILDKSAGGLAQRVVTQDKTQLVDPLTKEWPLPFSSLNEAMNFIKQFTDSSLSYQYFMNSLIETAEGYQMMFSSKAMDANIKSDVEWFELLPAFRCPVILIRAKGGVAVPDKDFTRMQTLIPNCIAREMSHSDHNVHLSNKEEFYKYFDEFLAGV